MNERNAPFWRHTKDEATLWARKELQKIQRTRQVASTGQYNLEHDTFATRRGKEHTFLFVGVRTDTPGEKTNGLK